MFLEAGMNSIYFLSKVSYSSEDSLEDGGANGGVVVNDVRVITKHPDRTADSRDMDDQKVSSVTLATAGGVALTTSGEAIIVTHQHACRGVKKLLIRHPKLSAIRTRQIIDQLKQVVVNI